ncbi:serine hydrolase domain-containing protein [Aureibaculum conchae]|uniref:serine hydrolase domain-containing protein n=1 Tax=Aureibaculum sp. 2308TA14-22 TaxID=3108392 RepID=UPI003394BD1E
MIILKKYFVVILLTLLVVLSSFFLGAKPLSTQKDVGEPFTTIATQIEKESPILIEKYPLKQTKKVSNKLDSLLHRINKRHDFHGSLLVAKNGKILYDSHVGYANFKKKEPLNERSVFQLASVSKQFTAAAIMLLYERNQIQLTDTVNKYFPDFPYEDITIKNLLNHTSGLPKYFWVAEHEWKQKKAPTNSEMMTLLESSKAQRFFKPGRKFDYSNTGYFVLASIVEKVSGESFSTFVTKNIFEPLDMNDSFVLSSENERTVENHLEGYRLYRGWRHLKINNTVNDAIVGDKNVYSSSRDLYKWVNGLNNGKLLSKESVNLMYARGETVYGKKVPYGFGLRINTKDQNMIYHYGKWNGFSTGLTQYQEDELVVIILEHTSYNAMASLNKKVKKIIMENFQS